MQTNETTQSIKVASTPAELVSMVHSDPDVRKTLAKYKPEDFCLKVQGKEEYLLEDVPLYRFKVSREVLI